MFDFLKKKNAPVKPLGFEVNNNWSSVVSKGINDYISLTTSERIWFNVREIIDSINDGGLISYYYNSGAKNIYDAIEDLKLLGFDNIALIIQKYNAILFKNAKVPTDIDKRNEYINNLNDQTDDLLQNLEFEITDLLSDLETQLAEFLKKEKLIDK